MNDKRSMDHKMGGTLGQGEDQAGMIYAKGNGVWRDRMNTRNESSFSGHVENAIDFSIITGAESMHHSKLLRVTSHIPIFP